VNKLQYNEGSLARSSAFGAGNGWKALCILQAAKTQGKGLNAWKIMYSSAFPAKVRITMRAVSIDCRVCHPNWPALGGMQGAGLACIGANGGF